ncbi:Ig-like domain-containing protein [Dyella koreensis]|uniref:Bacterial Ig-like domain-containing protein n=1 Tax=Dyella koreensis TaxID=311235 RepID=A0ABW8JZH1_9GAMM
MDGKDSEPFDIFVDVLAPPSALTIDAAYDNVGSPQGELSSGATTDDASPMLRGTAEPFTLVTIVDDHGTVLGSVSTEPYGNWTFQVNGHLDAGVHYLKAIAQYGQASEPFEITIADVPAPPVAAPVIIYGLDAFGPIHGYVRNGESTDGTHVRLRGRGAANTLLSIEMDGHVVGEVRTDDLGNWSFKPESPLQDGKHVFTASVSDGSPAATSSSSTSRVHRRRAARMGCRL